MNHARTALLLRRLARLGLVERRDLHHLARMPADRQRDYAAEVLRWARADGKSAAKAVGDCIMSPDVIGPWDVVGWLGSAATWLVAAGILALADAESVADEAQSAQDRES